MNESMNLLTIQTLDDETVVRSFLNYENENLALSALYQTLASATVNNTVVACVCELIGDNGTVCKMDFIDKRSQENPVEEAE
jgi:hypothetical protein